MMIQTTKLYISISLRMILTVIQCHMHEKSETSVSIFVQILQSI